MPEGSLVKLGAGGRLDLDRFPAAAMSGPRPPCGRMLFKYTASE
jgi:hypothetical protein